MDSYNSGSVGRWLTGTCFDESAARAAFGSSLPLSKLQRDLAHLPTEPAALTAALDRARAAGVPPTQYALALKTYWIAQAMQDAGIDPALWDPAFGADARGNEALLHREQFEIIGKDDDDMRNHGVTGEAFTYALRGIGAPSIPGAHTYNEIDPLVLHQDLTPKSFGTPSSVFGVGIPPVSVDDPLHVQVDITTPLPDGNISGRDDRWKLPTQDTLPAYQHLLDTDIERARTIIASDVAGRVDDQRLVHQVDDSLLRLVTDWDIGVSR